MRRAGGLGVRACVDGRTGIFGVVRELPFALSCCVARLVPPVQRRAGSGRALFLAEVDDLFYNPTQRGRVAVQRTRKRKTENEKRDARYCSSQPRNASRTRLPRIPAASNVALPALRFSVRDVSRTRFHASGRCLGVLSACRNGDGGGEGGGRGLPCAR